MFFLRCKKETPKQDFSTKYCLFPIAHGRWELRGSWVDLARNHQFITRWLGIGEYDSKEAALEDFLHIMSGSVDLNLDDFRARRESGSHSQSQDKKEKKLSVSRPPENADQPLSASDWKAEALFINP